MFKKLMEHLGDATASLLAGLLGVIGVGMDSENTRKWLYEYYLEEESFRLSKTK